MNTNERDELSTMWEALKQECCKAPDKARQIVFLSEEKFRKAMASFVSSTTPLVEFVEQTNAATRMRGACVAKVKAIHEERLRDLRALTEKGEIEHEDAEYERAVLFVLGNVIDALKSLTLDQVEQQQ